MNLNFAEKKKLTFRNKKSLVNPGIGSIFYRLNLILFEG